MEWWQSQRPQEAEIEQGEIEADEDAARTASHGTPDRQPLLPGTPGKKLHDPGKNHEEDCTSHDAQH